MSPISQSIAFSTLGVVISLFHVAWMLGIISGALGRIADALERIAPKPPTEPGR